MLCFLGISCQKDSASDPEILEGNYVTSPILDFRCVALLPNQLPKLTVSRISKDEFAVALHMVFPEKKTIQFTGITLESAKEGFNLIYKNGPAGNWKNVSYLDNKKILNIGINTADEWVYFVGEKE